MQQGVRAYIWISAPDWEVMCRLADKAYRTPREQVEWLIHQAAEQSRQVEQAGLEESPLIEHWVGPGE